jgi:hypothetical protein
MCALCYFCEQGSGSDSGSGAAKLQLPATMRLQCAAKMSPLQCNLHSYRPAQLLYDADILAVLAEEGEQQLALWPCTAMPRGTLADVMLNTAADATATAAPSITATDPTADQSGRQLLILLLLLLASLLQTLLLSLHALLLQRWQ